MLEMLGEGTFGKVYKGECRGGAGRAGGQVGYGGRPVATPRSDRAARVQTCIRRPPSPRQPKHLACCVAGTGLWRGTEVAIKTIVLPARMSGKEKREKMAVMEAAISSVSGAVVAWFVMDTGGVELVGWFAWVVRVPHVPACCVKASTAEASVHASSVYSHQATTLPGDPPCPAVAIAPQHRADLHLPHPPAAGLLRPAPQHLGARAGAAGRRHRGGPGGGPGGGSGGRSGGRAGLTTGRRRDGSGGQRPGGRRQRGRRGSQRWPYTGKRDSV